MDTPSRRGQGLSWLGPLATFAGDPTEPAPIDPLVEWASSGALSLTGTPDSPLLCPSPIVGRLRSVGEALRFVSSACGDEVTVDPLEILVERAAYNRSTRGGSVSCGGRTRLLQAGDGWIALSLARADDMEAAPALVGQFSSVRWDPRGDTWGQIASAISHRSASTVVEAGRLLGLPLASLGEVGAPRYPVVPTAFGPPMAACGLEGALVVDLSALWAGPLCSRLLAQGGASIIKVESVHRPDGARRGNSQFFDALNGSVRSVALDVDRPEHRGHLVELMRQADVVIEGSRPRALAQWGVSAEQALADGQTKVWISITGYGRRGRAAGRVAFGDDAAVAGGLVAWDRGVPNFVLDAVADPLTGLVAATAAMAALQSDQRWLLDVSLSRVAAWLNGGGGKEWNWMPARSRPDLPVTPPRRPTGGQPAPALGADTDAVLASPRPRPASVVDIAHSGRP